MDNVLSGVLFYAQGARSISYHLYGQISTKILWENTR